MTRAERIIAADKLWQMHYQRLCAARAMDGDDKLLALSIASEAFQLALREVDETEEADPSPYCCACGAMREASCHCGPIADND